MTETHALTDDLNLLEQTVRDAGALALAFKGHGLRTEFKDDRSPVTEADLAVDRCLRRRLTEARPDYGWLSEESADDLTRLECKRVWIVDPIDGTRAYIKGRPHWCVSAALVEDGRPVAAAIYNPENEELFLAARGAGARMNGAPIHTGARSAMEGCRILASPGLPGNRRWRGQWPPMEISSVNSIAYRICLVANGAYDATLTLSCKSDWDLAAADLLVQEAGGRMTTPDGAPFLYNGRHPRQNGVLAAGPALHAAFRGLIRRTQVT